MYKSAVLPKIKPHSLMQQIILENFPFITNPSKKTKIKRLKNIDRLAELPFYEQLSVIKTHQAFKGYAISYKVEIIEKKDPIVILKASKSSIKDLFSDLSNETIQAQWIN